MFAPPAWVAMLAALVPHSGPEVHADMVSAPHDGPDVPERFRLPAVAYRVEWTRTHDLPGSEVEVFAIRLPSAVETPFGGNNIVHAEYFRPKSATSASRQPAAVVFDILDGAGVVSRGQGVWLASQGIPAVCVTLPYYGPRRPTVDQAGGKKLRFLSTDINGSIGNVRQGVLDGRRVARWLATQPEVDPARVAVVGTSLGSFVGALVAASEPAVSTACLLLGGGGLVESFAADPRAATVLAGLALFGVTPDTLKPILAPVDPLTYADQLKSKRLLLIGASRDDVVPPAALTRLWQATGKPRIVWYDATHVGSAAYGFAAMTEVIAHLHGHPPGNGAGAK